MSSTAFSKNILSNFGLAILASAGLMYANISPAIVSAFAQNPNFTGESSGYLISINMYGTAFGALSMSFFVDRLNWRRTATWLLTFLILFDLISITFGDPNYLYAIRFSHGLMSGLLVALAYAAIARRENPEKILALAIMLQLFFGGILILLLTPLIQAYGSAIIWLCLIVFYLIAFLFTPLLSNYTVNKNIAQIEANYASASRTLIAITLVAYFLFQSGQFAVFSYVIELGLTHEFDSEFTSRAVAMGLWVGGPAALFVTWWSIRTGRLLPIVIASSLQIISIAILLLPYQSLFLAGNIGFGIFFSIAHPYILGVASELDNTGRIAALAAFAGSLGLATGPGVGAVLVGESNYDRVALFAILILTLSLILIILPAYFLDAKSRTQRVNWT